jgi:hypothetical protein
MKIITNCPDTARHVPPPHRSKVRTRPQLLVRAELDGRRNAAKAFDKLAGEIIADLGGREVCTSLEINLVEATSARLSKSRRLMPATTPTVHAPGARCGSHNI